MVVKLLTERHLWFLRLKGSCAGSPLSTLVKMPHCWKSPVAAQKLNLKIHAQLSNGARSIIVSAPALCVCQLCWSFTAKIMGLDARKHDFVACEQQRRSPTCASTQSDQSLCYSLHIKNDKLCSIEISRFQLDSPAEQPG